MTRSSSAARLLAIGTSLLLAVPSPGTAAETVAVTSREEADGRWTLVHEILVAAPIGDVWTAISTAQGWMTWAVPLARTLPGDPDLLETSYDPDAEPGGPDTIQQRFTARIPGRLLAYRTVKAPDGFPHWEAYRQVTNLFELESVGAQTRVRLTSTGYPADDAGRALVAFFTRGNAVTLEALQKRFRDGPIDWAATDGQAPRD